MKFHVLILAFIGGILGAPTVDVAKRTAVGDQIVAAADFIKRGDFIAAEEAIRRGFEIERRGSCGSCPPDPTQFVFFGSYKE